MAKTLNRLPANILTKQLPPSRHADGGNLYLSVSTSGAKRWVFLYRGENSRPVEMGLGAARDVPLAKARDKAAAARALLADGKDPLEVRCTEEAVPTFGEVAEALIESMRPSWKSQKHADQWVMTLLGIDREGKPSEFDYCKSIRDKRVDRVDTDHLLQILRPIWQEKPETASRLRGRIERVLDAARVQGHRKGENPARWRGHLDMILPTRTKLSRGHFPAMPYAQVPAFVHYLRQNVTMSNLALEFTILTAARSTESREMVWTELDRVDLVWTVPAARMKEQREHRVPLCARAIEILEIASRIAGKRQSEFAFPGAKPRRPLSDMSLTMALRRAKHEEFTVHGFRSSFRDWAGDETDFAREVAEAALSHLVGDEAERAYRRSDAIKKRRALMDAWAEYVGSYVPQQNAAEIRDIAA
ncbi:integrase arm-type DNA-binding domain-containing protein [Bradyrhizobium sp. CCGUVB1N3]|uniref:tyrosine-type recombinase/integrase n=1 Tax=Bradyrhizobium sp. CCGUVB1N3 TaxID=2949629 RepID=UPI0020B2B132|nr:site-specific integrase [Bradyrhizobium sp. CCGUVB1N3]MCP3469824.1 integrase arm-type DNA-binding domain-containing protein [Bradyrhizobium sp. CCGUVB1N3]